MKSLTRFASLAVPVLLVAMTGGCPWDPTEPTSEVAYVSIRSASNMVAVGASITVDADVVDHDNRTVATPVTWVSSNPAIATVPNSTGSRTSVTGVSAGTVTISATADGKSASAQITVTDHLASADGILFTSTRDGNAEIYLLEMNGPRNLTQHPGSDIHPTKHGNRVFFSSNRSGNFEIYSMKLDGTDITRLTNNTVTDYLPSVSSNGQVAFAREVSPGREQIFTMNVLGQNQANISNNAFHEENPVWNPTGTKLVFASDRDAKFGARQYLELYSMNSDGSGVSRLTTNDNGIDYHPAWSPDGSKIAFNTNRSANPSNPSDPTCYAQAGEIWVMNADGTGLRNLTNSCRGEAWPSWSPDGSQIVFGSDRGSATPYAWDLWKIPSAGGTATRLTATGKEATPAWR